MSITDPKKSRASDKHHYIPKFYTKRWTRNGQLVIFEKTAWGLDVRDGSPKSTGYQSKLYATLTIPQEVAPDFEKEFFEPADTQAERAMFILGRGKEVYKDNLRDEWAKFISGLLLRCPEDVENFRLNWTKYRVEVPAAWELRYSETRQPNDPPTLAEKVRAIPDTTSELRMFRGFIELISNKNVNAFIKKMRWATIDTSRATQRLLTSDRPVLRTNGLNKRNGHVVLAIGPTRLFVAAFDGPSMSLIKQVAVSDLVRRYNKQIVQGAARYVYADDRSQARFVMKHIGTRPQPRLVEKFFLNRDRVIRLVDSDDHGELTLS